MLAALTATTAQADLLVYEGFAYSDQSDGTALNGGKFILRAEVSGANPASQGARYLFGLDCVTLLPPAAGQEAAGNP